MPKPIVDSVTPCLRAALDRSTGAPRARAGRRSRRRRCSTITRVIAPGRSPFIACSYARSMPERHRRRAARGQLVDRGEDPRLVLDAVVGSTTPRRAGVGDERDRVARLRLSVRICSDCFASGSLSARAIEPETSTRNTRFAGLRSLAGFGLRRDADAQDVAVGRERRRRGIHHDRERRARRRRGNA